ncbi:MAG: hypothetical protein PWP11_893 [Thauera sp.]|nr:hypothetical protein [Thauera sp.]MDI3489616.1 hypothetical protein [Thauera sp.]
MTAHTQGPWTVNTQADYPNPRIDGPNGRAVGHAIQRDPHPATGQGITPAEAMANARLMASGPELLEALHGLLNALPSATTHPAIKSARAAISRATGERE